MTAPVPLRRNRDFLYLWSGQAVSVLGSQASRVAYPLLVLAIAGSAAKAGLASAAATLPYLLFPLLAGAYADRHDRRRIMIACDVLRLVALCAVATGRAVFSVVLVAGFAEGTGTAYYNVANRAAIPMIVHESQRATALAQNEARANGAQLAGPALGGALFGLSRFLPFAADALSYVGSLFTLATIRTPMREARPEEPRQLVRDLAEGLRLTLRQPFLRASSVLAAVVNLCLQVLSLAIIVLARGDGASAALTGAIVACMGAGGLCGSFAAPWLQRRVRPGVIITSCVWAWAVLIGLLTIIRSPVWLCPVTTMIGVAGSPWNVAVQTYRLRWGR
jgi:MFS family permease